MRRFGRGSFLSSIGFFLRRKFFSGPISILVRSVSTAIIAHRPVAISTSILKSLINKRISKVISFSSIFSQKDLSNPQNFSYPDCNIHKIADLKLGALQRDILVGRFSSRDSFSDFFHSIAVHSRVLAIAKESNTSSIYLINDCEMEFCSFLARFWIDSSDEIRDLLQRRVHPGVHYNI